MAERFGTLPTGECVDRVQLTSDQARVSLIGFGAAIQSIEVPDAEGRWANVVLGFGTLADYVARSPHFGATPGRYAGRLAGGQFVLDGVRYTLPRNDGPNTLHGGFQGFGKRAWVLTDTATDFAAFTLHSPDGDAGFPGAVDVEVRYTLDGASLRIDYRAETSRPTVINLTNHSYFNLAGEGSGCALSHRLAIHADRFAPTDAAGIPTGAVLDVEGTPFDFRAWRRIGERIRTADPQLLAGKGYDHGYLVEGAGLRLAAQLADPDSGRVLHVHTTAPSVQLYTGNSLDGRLAGPAGRAYRQSDAICLEAQHLPDSPNQPGFPSTVLRPGETYRSTIVFAFAANRSDTETRLIW